MNIAVFPGSFDPVTIGHHDVVMRALPLFEKIIIGIGNNTTKNYLFPVDKRLELIQSAFGKENKIEVKVYSGLTVDFCKSLGARFIIRGLRNSSDFDFEQSIAQMNRAMAPALETFYLPCKAEYAAVSSSIIREIIRHGGDVSSFLPPGVKI